MSGFNDPAVTPTPAPQQASAFVDPAVNQSAPAPAPAPAAEPGFWEQVANYGSQAVDWAQENYPKSEDFPEMHPTLFGEFQYADTPIGMFNIVRKSRHGKNKNIRLDEDAYGNPGVVDLDDGQFYYFNKPGASMNDLNLTKIGLNRIAPAVAGGPWSAAGKTMLSQAGRLGLAEGLGETAYQIQKSIMGADEGFDYNRVLLSAAFAMGGELGTRMLTPVVSRVWRRLFGKADDIAKYFDGEKWTDEGLELLARNDVDIDTLDDVMLAELAKSDLLSPEQAARYNFMRKQGIERPTRAQVTQNRQDFADQQQIVRSDVGDEVRDVLDIQNRQMIDKAEAVSGATGGITRLRQSTSADISDYVTRRALADDAAVSKFYQNVRERLPDQKIIKMPKLVSWLKQHASDNEATGGALKAVWGDLRARGVIDKNGKVIGRVTANTAEEIRKKMNELFGGGNQYAKTMMGRAKDMLDDDVFRYLGRDSFKEARAAKRKFHTLYTDFRRNKLQKRGQNILEKLYDGSISPDRAFDRLITGNVDDLQRVKSFMLDYGDKEGVQMWNNIRAQVIQDAIAQATKSGKTQLGDPLWNAKAFKKVIDSHTQKGKLGVLFEPEEITELLNIMKLGKIRDPIRDTAGSTALGHGPSAPAIERATNLMADMLRRAPSMAGRASAEVVKKGGDKAKKQVVDAYMREAAQDALSPSKRSIDAIQQAMRVSRETSAGRIAGPAGGLAAIGGYQSQAGDER